MRFALFFSVVAMWAVLAGLLAGLSACSKSDAQGSVRAEKFYANDGSTCYVIYNEAGVAIGGSCK